MSQSAVPATTDLASVCPNPIRVVQNWTPQAEQGAVYELAASGGKIDGEAKTYTAPLIDGGKPTGVDIQIIAGGPAIGFAQPPAYLYLKQDVLLANGALDQVIATYSKVPVVQLIAPLRINPQILMWNPEKYQISDLKDVSKTGAPVLYFKGSTYMDYLIGSGYVQASQADGSYKGAPDRWVGSNGGVFQQGFATQEPFVYTNQLPAWNKPVAYGLIASTGYNAYQGLETRTDNVTKYQDCFKKLIPMVQRAQISFINKPERVVQLMIALIEKYGIGGPYDSKVASYTVRSMLENKIVSDPPDGSAFGSIDMSNVQRLLDALRPILAKAGTPLASDMTPAKVATNQFLDPSIHFTSYKGPYNSATGIVILKP